MSGDFGEESGPSAAAGFPMEGAAIKSTRRTLEVFEYFAERQVPASLSELVHALGYPQSSTSALLKSLVNLGYLEYQRDTRLYVPTLRIVLVSGWLHEGVFGNTNLIQVVQAIRRRVGGVIALGLQNGIFVQYLMTLKSEGQRLQVRTGSLRPICRSAIGRVLLSGKPQSEVVALLGRANAKEPDPGNRVERSDLLKALASCRSEGHAYTEGTVSPGRAVIAMPLPPLPGRSPMAIGVGGPIEKMRRARSRIVGLMKREIETLTSHP